MLKIGILGTSSIAKKAIIPALQSLPDLYTVVGVGSRSFDAAKDLCKEFEIQPFKSYEELIELGNLQAIYIPLPNSLHKEWVEKALNRNLHVLVEKSLACTLYDVKTLCSLAKKKNRALVENFQFRKHSQFSKIISLLNNNEIGELRCIKSSFGFPPFPDQNNIRYQLDLGGGALLDAGAYPIKIAQLFLGSDINVTSAKFYVDNQRKIDLWGGGFIEQENGDLFAEISFGFDNYYQCNLELWGSKGKITAERIFTAPPNFAPSIILENSAGKQIISLEQDNHYIKMLKYFYEVTCNEELQEKELSDNISQSRLIEQFKIIANGK